jgi:hypothetical protein
MPEKGVDPLVGEIAKREAPGLEPPSKVSGQEQQLLGGRRRVPLREQVGREPFGVRPQRPRNRHRSGIEHACLLDGDMP